MNAWRVRPSGSSGGPLGRRATKLSKMLVVGTPVYAPRTSMSGPASSMQSMAKSIPIHTVPSSRHFCSRPSAAGHLPGCLGWRAAAMAAVAAAAAGHGECSILPAGAVRRALHLRNGGVGAALAQRAANPLVARSATRACDSRLRRAIHIQRPSIAGRPGAKPRHGASRSLQLGCLLQMAACAYPHLRWHGPSCGDLPPHVQGWVGVRWK